MALPWMKIIEGAKKATGATMGVGQAIAGKIQRKKADALLPASEDPMMRQALSSLQRRRDMLATGTANNADRVAAKQLAKTMANNSFRTGGQANTGVISSALSSALANINAQNREQVAAYDQMATEQMNTMAQRKADLNMYRSQVMSARAEQNISAARDNISNTFATNGDSSEGSFGGGKGGGKKKKTASGGVLKGVMGTFK